MLAKEFDFLSDWYFGFFNTIGRRNNWSPPDALAGQVFYGLNESVTPLKTRTLGILTMLFPAGWLWTS